MKKLLFLLLLPLLAFAQQPRPFGPDKNASDFFLTNKGTAIRAKAFTSATSDTTEVLRLVDFKTAYFNVQVQDSATVLIYYALSDDGSNFPTFTLKDSLTNSSTGSGFKSLDLTATTLGARYLKMRWTFSALAFPLGTTTATYSASFTLKKQ